MSDKDLRYLRRDFPFFDNPQAPLYFDSAATTHKPRPVLEALHDFYTHHYATVHRAVYQAAQQATEAYQSARNRIQKFLGADHPEEIIFTRGTTASLNLVARSFIPIFLKKGDGILISEIEHHSNLVPWQMVCEQYGLKLHVAPVDDQGELDWEAFLALLKNNIKFISIAHISNVIGTQHPIEKIVQAARQVGAYVCVDGAQSVSHLPVNVQDLDVDFFAFSGHKIYGPTGIGVLFGKRELLEKMPPIEGGGDMIEEVTWEKTTYQPTPLKFEAGTPMIAEVIGLGAAIKYVEEIGLPAILSWENHLLEEAQKMMQAIPHIRLIGTAKQKGPILTFAVEGMHALDVATLLDCKGVALRSGHLCSQVALKRFNVPAFLRLSFGLYNHPEEISRFGEFLKEIVLKYSKKET